METGNRPTKGDISTKNLTGNPGYHATDAADELTEVRGLTYYDTNVDPVQKPRDINDVWGDIVRLFDEPLSPLYPYFTTCPQALKDVLLCDEAYVNEDDFNMKLFTVLRNSLAEENLIDNFKNDDAKDNDHVTKIDRKDDSDAEHTTESDTTKKKKDPIQTIVFTHGKCGEYAIGIARAAILEHSKRGKNQGDDAIASDSRKRKLDPNNSTTFADDSQRTNISGLMVANAKVDHCACILVNTGEKWQVVDCLAAIELKLAKKKENMTCAAFPKNANGMALRNSLELKTNHGSLAQAMLYTMGFALPSLAKLGQLEEEIPWCVLVSECYRKPDDSNQSAGDSKPSDGDTKPCAGDSKPGAGDSKRTAEGSNLATHPPIFSSTSSRGTSKFASQPSKSADQSMKNTGRPPCPTPSVASNQTKRVASNHRTKRVASNLLRRFSRGRTTHPPPSIDRNNPPSSVANNLMPSGPSNPTPSDQGNPIPSDQSNSTPSDQSNPTLSDQSNPTPSDQSNPTPSDQSNPTPSDQSNPTPSDRSNLAASDRSNRNPSDASNPTPGDGSDPTANDRSNRWVSGKIYVPKACGDIFRYAVTGYGGFETSTGDESVDDALSVYLETILFGLRAAMKWMLSKKNNKPCCSVPISGQAVMIGSKDLTSPRLPAVIGEENLPPILTLRGRLGKLNEEAPDQGGWTISQGEIFTGRLNIHQMTEEFKLGNAVFLAFSNEDADVDVVVKVSSLAVHGSLTLPERAWNALTLIYTSMEKATKWNADVEVLTMFRNAGWNPPHSLIYDKPPTPPRLDDVLLAVHARPKGLITIMKDLSVEKYQTLRPWNFAGYLSTLWKAFIELLREVLIPMADLDIIHPDLRPGYDVTSNILWKFKDETDTSEGAIMKLIDFESILHVSKWNVPGRPHSFYVEKEDGWNGKTFLWWQCMAIAYAWNQKSNQQDLAEFGLKKWVRLAGTVDEKASWLKGFYLDHNTEREEMTVELLEELVTVFPDDSQASV